MKNIGLYLRPTQAIDSEHKSIKEVARELSSGSSVMAEKAVKLFYFVRDRVPYSLFMISMYPEDFRASRVLEWKKGYCVQKAVLLAALGRAMGIPSRLAFAKIRNHRVPAQLRERMGTDIFPRHCYNQLYLDERWVSVATNFDRELCRRNGFPPVEFNGVDDAFLPPKDLAGNPYVEYLVRYGPRADLPLKWITRETSKIWGTEKRPWLKEEDFKEW